MRVVIERMDGTRETRNIGWHCDERPQVGDSIARPGILWRVRWRQWEPDGDVTIGVEEFPQ